MAEVVLARVTDGAIDEAMLERFAATSRDGAVVVFRGVVRDHDGGHGVTLLEYEAHPEAEAFLRAAADRAASSGSVRIAVAHRVGTLAVGDVALVAVVASAHRAEAFARCASLVDDLKASVPIWKRQHRDDGVTEWVGL